MRIALAVTMFLVCSVLESAAQTDRSTLCISSYAPRGYQFGLGNDSSRAPSVSQSETSYEGATQASTTVAQLLEQQAEALGILCPTNDYTTYPPDSSQTLKYFANLRESGFTKVYIVKIEPVAWEHAEGLFDIIATHYMEVVSLRHSDGRGWWVINHRSRARAAHWARDLRRDSLGDFAAETMGNLLNQYEFYHREFVRPRPAF